MPLRGTEMKRVTALFLALGLLAGMASGPMAQPARAGSLKVCGEVTVYVKATVLGTGLLTINGVPFVILAGASLPAAVAVGADLCLDLSTNLLGLVTGAAVTANVSTKLKLCGTVVAYTKATATTAGLLKIGAKTLTIGIGNTLPATVAVGANLCIDLELDAFGRVKDGEVIANVETHLKICGKVSAYVKATASTEGLLTIAGRTFKIAVDEDLPAVVDVDADLCLDLTLNAFGQISDCGAILNVESTLDVCGQVTAYAAAGSTTNGSLTIAGLHKVIAAGADIDTKVKAAAYLKLRLTVDAFARIAKATVLKVGISVDDACGTGSTPAPTQNPGPTQGPGFTQEPGATTDPGPTQAPGHTPGPGGTDAPDATDGPGASDDPDPSAAPTPTQVVGGVTDDCTDNTANANTTDTGTLLPDTDSLGRAAGVVATNAIPLIAVGLLGGFAAWYRSRRNREALEAEMAAVAVAEPPIDSTETDGVGA